MHFDPKRRRVIIALALVELAIVGTMITAVTWRHDRLAAAAATTTGGPNAPRFRVVDVDDEPHVVIDAGNFAIDVIVGPDGKVSYEDVSISAGAIGDSHRKIAFEATDDGAKLTTTESPTFSLGVREHRLRLTVPKATNLEITDCASASIADLTGEVHVRSGNGTVTLQNLATSVVDVEAGNGRVEATGVKTGSLTIHASNGRVIAQRITISGVDPQLNVTASNGKIEFGGRLPANGTYTMESSNGSVNVGLTGDSDTTVTASTANGSVRAGAGVSLREDGDDRIAKFGAGRGALNVSSSNGSVTISRMDGV